MPFSSKAIDDIRASRRDTNEIASYRMACAPWPVLLPDDMASALGSAYSRRRLTPFAGVAVDVIAAKLEIDRAAIKLVGATETKAVSKWLADSSWATTERDLWQATVRDGQAFLLVNWRQVSEFSPDYQEPGPVFEVVTAYDGKSGAGTLGPGITWNYWDDAEAEYFDVYYDSIIEKYIRPKTIKIGNESLWVQRTDTPDELWPLPWISSDGQPLGCALIHFCLSGSDIADAIQLSKDLNEAVLDMLATSRTQGWPQRFLKGARNSDVMTNGLGQPVISAHTNRPIKKQINLAPGAILSLSDNSELGQLSPAAVSRVMVDTLLELLSFVTTVPTHYFSGQWPSGAAIGQAETRLNHLVEEHQSRLSQPTASVISLIMRLSNAFEGTTLKARQAITIPWMTPEIETDEVRAARAKATRDHVIELHKEGLMSIRVALRAIHPDWTEAEIEAEAAELKPVPVVAGTDIAQDPLTEEGAT